MKRLRAVVLLALSFLTSDVQAMKRIYSSLPEFPVEWSLSDICELMEANRKIDRMMDDFIMGLMPQDEWYEWEKVDQRCDGRSYRTNWIPVNRGPEETIIRPEEVIALNIYHWPSIHHGDTIESFPEYVRIDMNGHPTTYTVTKVNDYEIVIDYSFEGSSCKELQRAFLIGDYMVIMSYSHFPSDCGKIDPQADTNPRWEAKRSLWLQRFIDFPFNLPLSPIDRQSAEFVPVTVESCGSS